MPAMYGCSHYLFPTLTRRRDWAYYQRLLLYKQEIINVHHEISFNEGPFVIQSFICPQINVSFYRKLIKIWPTNT